MPQLTFTRQLPTLCACAIAAAMSLVACSSDSDAAQPGKGTEARTSYELVTVMHAASAEKYLWPVRLAYDACAITASMQSRAVKPFPVLPANLELGRTVYISDGKAFYTRESTTVIEMEKIKPDTGCVVSFKTDSQTTIVRGGVMYATDTAAGKETALAPSAAVALRMPNESVLPFTVPKKVNGVALKCLPPDAPASAMGEACIVDPDLAKLADSSGMPLSAYWRGEEPAANTDVIVEPVSLKIGAPVDPAVFEARAK